MGILLKTFGSQSSYRWAPAGVFSKMFGIVEFSDGVRRVDPTEIVFCDEDNKMLKEIAKGEYGNDQN